MAQTRAISRACRSAFAHVVVMIDADLATTPAEEVPDGGFIDVTPEPKAETNSGGMPDAEFNRLNGMMRSARSEEHTSELQSLMRISYAVFCLKKKQKETRHTQKP